MTYQKDYPFTSDCTKIMLFMSDIQELALKHEKQYQLYFSPLQVSLALEKKSAHGVRKYMSLLCKKGYLSRHKQLKSGDKSTTLYSVTIEQYNDWVEDERHFVRLAGNQFGTKIRK